MDDLIAEFLTETNEGLGELDTDMVKLEQNPNDKELLSSIFRIMHTIKGTCGFLGLPRLEGVAHKAEDVLGLFRDGQLEVTQDYVTLIFESLDRIKYIIGEIEATGGEPEGSDEDLIAKLEEVYKKGGGENADEAALEAAFSDTGQDETMEEPAPPQAENAGKQQEKEQETTAAAEVENLSAEQHEIRESNVSNQSLRVNVDVLENLMTMISELVLTRNQLLQISKTQSENQFATPLQRLNHVVSDLQEGVMKTRMQPIGNAWAKLPRIIRDISIDLDKKIDLEMQGKDTELDRQVLELIKDPLTHMVRNSADHGIETPKERIAAGKPETGKILLKSYHEGGHILIEISDDGKGLPVDKIRKKVLANGLATEEELAELNAQQIQQFIFKPGFSTAEKVTSVSGRGVGMDVVRTNIEKIGGSIELKSVEGKGSTFLIKIPLTLAIVSALIVEAGHERFAIPQLSVRELVMTSAEGENRIETIKGTPVFRLRDHLLPLIPLQELLDLEEAAPKIANDIQNKAAAAEEEEEEEEEKTEEAKTAENHGHHGAFNEAKYLNKYIVVTQVGAYTFGIIVDRVYDTEEIVVKPVSRMLKNIEIFSGNTILGDGKVIMILDPAGIAKRTGEIDMSEAKEAGKEDKHIARAKDKTSLLLFTAGGGAPKAVPLELVSRLEEIDVSDIESANEGMVIQYRGELMPLLTFNDRVKIGDEGHKPVLVFSDDGESMGLIVDKIIDIMEEHIDVKISGTRPGIIGSAIINDKATDVTDVSFYLQKTNKNWFRRHSDEPYKGNGSDANGAAHHENKRILLVEDSPFFRNMLTPLLQMAGYEVISTESPAEALDMCESGEAFDVILSDIEMPEMNGFELAEKIKQSANWNHIPLVALSSHATQQDIARGTEAGFSRYIAKFDRETLLDTLSQTLAEEQQQEQREAS